MDWNNPSARAALIERVGPKEYSRQWEEHCQESTLETVAGHAIRPVYTRFGALFAVGSTGTAYQTIEQARAHANANPVGGNIPPAGQVLF